MAKSLKHRFLDSITFFCSYIAQVCNAIFQEQHSLNKMKLQKRLVMLILFYLLYIAWACAFAFVHVFKPKFLLVKWHLWNIFFLTHLICYLDLHCHSINYLLLSYLCLNLFSSSTFDTLFVLLCVLFISLLNLYVR